MTAASPGLGGASARGRPASRVTPAWGVRGWAIAALALAFAMLLAGALAGVDVRPALRWCAAALMLVAAIEDARTRRIRNVLTAPAAVLALAGAPGLESAVLGAVAAPLPLLAVSLARPGGMGMGDLKMAAVAGALLGVDGLPGWWLGTALAGGVLALAVLARGRRDATLAYGPALASSLFALLLS